MVDFLILGAGQNAGGMKDIFCLFKEHKIKYGYSITSGYRFFEVNDDYEFYGTVCKEDDGKRYIAVSGVRWFTTLRKDFPEQLLLTEKYEEGKYKKFDNYDIVFIEKTKDIPYDYDNVMAVPITFLDKWNPEQFDILGVAHNGSGGLDLFLPTIDGICKFRRLLIRKKSS